MTSIFSLGIPAKTWQFINIRHVFAEQRTNKYKIQAKNKQSISHNITACNLKFFITESKLMSKLTHS